jgi:uncharacterized tellurite resistance protein B-like protein
MAINDFSLLQHVFTERTGAPDIEQLYREAMLMTLARATDADAHTSPVEVDTVRAVYRRFTGEEISAADVRVAAASELFARTPLEKLLGQVSRRLEPERCRDIVRALIEVIRVDGQLRAGEGDFFNRVVGALRLTPIDIVAICGG